MADSVEELGAELASLVVVFVASSPCVNGVIGIFLSSTRCSFALFVYDFSSIFKYITSYYSAPDFMTCEFEGTLSGSDYFGYPNFKSPDAIVKMCGTAA